MWAVLKEEWGKRPWWMSLILIFCIYMAFIYSPWDLLSKPLAVDVDVWFGIKLTGWAAKVGGTLHWVVYGLGTWGFWYMKSWMHPWAAIYVLQIGIAMWVFAGLHGDATVSGWLTGLIPLTVFALLAILLYRSSHRFVGTDESTLTPEA